VPEYDVSFRLFTKDDIGEVDLTEGGQSSGSWYGPTDYTKDFTALWSRG
jgi:ribose transport system substrate-binding protein